MGEKGLFALRAMTNVDELETLIAQLEDGARRGMSVHVSARDAALLLHALDARLAAIPAGDGAGQRFRVVALRNEGDGESVVAYAATIEMATVLFSVAAMQHSSQKIRLYDGERVIDEQGAAGRAG